jgi:hypothetical protein
MPIYVMHRGVLIDRDMLPVNRHPASSSLPAPAVQSFQSYESPVETGTISSHRQREKDLHKSGSYDPRDTPASYMEARNGRRKARSPAKSS